MHKVFAKTSLIFYLIGVNMFCSNFIFFLCITWSAALNKTQENKVIYETHLFYETH